MGAIGAAGQHMSPGRQAPPAPSVKRHEPPVLPVKAQAAGRCPGQSTGRAVEPKGQHGAGLHLDPEAVVGKDPVEAAIAPVAIKRGETPGRAAIERLGGAASRGAMVDLLIHQPVTVDVDLADKAVLHLYLAADIGAKRPDLGENLGPRIADRRRGRDAAPVKRGTRRPGRAAGRQCPAEIAPRRAGQLEAQELPGIGVEPGADHGAAKAGIGTGPTGPAPPQGRPARA